MDNKVNYTVVGLFVIVLGIVAVSIFLWLTSIKKDEFTKTYITYVRDDVSGLSLQGAVRFNGVQVGYVSAISLSQQDSQQVKVVMKIAAGTPITTSTVATLVPQGITGIDYVGLTAKTPHAPLLTAESGQLYPIIPAAPSLLMRLSTVVKKLTDSVSTLSDDVSQVVDKQNRAAFKNNLLNIEKITDTVSMNTQEIGESIKSMKILLKNSALASQQLPRLLTDLNHTMTTVADAANSLRSSGENIMQTLHSTANSFTLLSQQLFPSTALLLQHLDGLTVDLQTVTHDLAQNPAVMIRGKAPAALGPGEK